MPIPFESDYVFDKPDCKGRILKIAKDYYVVECRYLNAAPDSCLHSDDHQINGVEAYVVLHNG